MRPIQLNIFSELHDGKRIFFCKTDFLQSDFEKIRLLSNDVVLVSGNSDYCITESLVRKMPQNIKTWYCQNKSTEHPKLVSLPLGLENSEKCHRDGHGVGWPHAVDKVEFIRKNCFPNNEKSNQIYSCFRPYSNPHHRFKIRQISISSRIITWEEPDVESVAFLSNILKSKATICAQGNLDGDNHRIYESLYLNSVPVTFNPRQYHFLHKNFNVVLIENPDDMANEELLEEKIDHAIKSKNSSKSEMLDADYWIERILKDAG